jgi:hypothetical protein
MENIKLVTYKIMYKILVIWFFMTIPLMIEVDRKLKKENNQYRNNPIVLLVLIWKSFWNVPGFYILWTIQLIKKIIK